MSTTFIVDNKCCCYFVTQIINSEWLAAHKGWGM